MSAKPEIDIDGLCFQTWPCAHYVTMLGGTTLRSGAFIWQLLKKHDCDPFVFGDKAHRIKSHFVVYEDETEEEEPPILETAADDSW